MRDTTADADEVAQSADSGASVEPTRLSIVVGVLICLLGIATLFGSLNLGYWDALGPGPGFFPFWLGTILTVLSAAWVLQTVRASRAAATSPGTTASPQPAADEQDAPPEYDLKTVVAIVVSLCFLAGVLETLGYQLSMLLFLLFHLMVLGRRGWLLSIVIAVAGSFGVFAVFTELLQVALPASTLPGLIDLGL
jgi:putative tricarboxylic transport membrane protein